MKVRAIECYGDFGNPSGHMIGVSIVYGI